MASTPRTSRHRWSETFKKCVVAEASEPGVTTARLHVVVISMRVGSQTG